MAYNFIISDNAHKDIDEIIDWYLEIDTKLAEDVVNETYLLFDLISQNPNIYRTRYKNLRLINLKKFPYQIVYQFTENSIKIIAVIHSKRNPKSWKSRK